MPHGLTAPLGEIANSKSRRPRLSEPHVEPIRKTLVVVVFEDFNQLLRLYLKELRKVHGIEVRNSKTVESVDQAMSIFTRVHPDLVITDLSLTSGKTEGYEILKLIKEISPKTIVVLATSNYHSGRDEYSREIDTKGFDAVFSKLDEGATEPHIDRLKSYVETITATIH